MKKSCLMLLALAFSFALSQNKVSPEVVKRELEFVTQTYVKVHPNLVDEEQVAAFETHAETIINTVTTNMTRAKVAVQAQRIVTWLKSAHDRVNLAGDTEFLPVSFYWASDGLVVFPDSLSDLQFPPASEVLAIGDLNVATLETKMQELVSGNVYGVREDAARLLAGKSVLEYLGVVQDNQVTLNIRTPDGKEQTLRVQLGVLQGKSGWLNFTKLMYTPAKSYIWQVDNVRGVGLFILEKCDYTEDYVAAVQAFFEAVTESNVRTIIIDLRNNRGGTTDVIPPFLRHLSLTRLKMPGHTQRITETSINQANRFDPPQAKYFRDVTAKTEPQGELYNVREQGVIEVPPNELLKPTFAGKVYFLVNGGTASAAIDFATIFSDNKLATLVGEPVGDSPTSAGNVVYFETPEIEISFKVSSALYTRPDPSRDPADTLMPDIYIPLTVRDIQQKRDPVKAWLDGLE